MPLSPNAIYHQKPTSRKRRPIITACMTTEGLGGDFLQCATLTEKGQYKVHSTVPALLAYFLQSTHRGTELVFHHLDHDARYLLEYLEPLSEQGYTTDLCLNGQGSLIFAKIRAAHGQVWYLRDSYALMPVELPDLAGLAGIPYAPYEAPLGIDDIGNQFAVRRHVEMLQRAYVQFTATLYTHFGITPSMTAGATAVKAWRTTLPENACYYRQRKEVEEAARAAYFGGLTFLQTYEEKSDVLKIDANAMYASSMRVGVPVRSPAYTSREMPDVPGLYYCRVVGDDSLPFAFVPAREGFSVRWPRGEFHSWLPSNTIALAQKCGYTITVEHGFYFDTIEYPFDAFIDKCEKLELEYQGLGVRLIIKFLRNSLYGKLGQKPDARQYHLTRTPDEEMTPVMDRDGKWVRNVYYKEVHVEQPHMQPVWAVWITAQARNVLAEAVWNINPASVYYGDTDSITADREAVIEAVHTGVITIGTGYGEWKYQEYYADFHALCLKSYVGTRHDGTLDIKSAGVPQYAIPPEIFANLERTDPPLTVHYTRMPRAVNTLGGRPKSVTVSREIRAGPH